MPSSTHSGDQTPALITDKGRSFRKTAHWAWTCLARLFRPRFDPTQLSASLRRDAGLDDADHERIKIVRSPLIR